MISLWLIREEPTINHIKIIKRMTKQGGIIFANKGFLEVLYKGEKKYENESIETYLSSRSYNYDYFVIEEIYKDLISKVRIATGCNIILKNGNKFKKIK